MKLKRITALILSMLMFCSFVFATSASAVVISSKGFDYQQIAGTNTVEILGITENGSEDTNPIVTIPYSLGGYPVFSIGKSAFINNENQQQIILPDSLVVISNSAFYDATSLTEITIPKNVSQIDYSAFAYCTSLESVNFKGTSLDVISEFTFYNCTKLDNVILPENLDSIDEKAFADCTSLKKIYIPNTTFDIAKNAFTNSKNVTIYGEYGSTAHIYALENSIPFKSLSNRSYTDIINWLNAVSYLDESKYTAVSYSALISAYDVALQVKNDFFSTQAEIDTAVNNLSTAYNALVLNSRLDLEKLVADTEYFLDSHSPYDYESQSYNEVRNTFISAQAVLENTSALDREIVSAYNRLQMALDSLMFQPEYDLIQTIEKADIILLSDKSIYTSDTLQALSNELVNAHAVLNNSESGYNEFLNANTALNKKINNLRLISYDTLKNNATLAQNNLNKNAYKYTATSVKALQTQINTANQLLSKQNATNNELLAQIDKLTQAVNALTPVTLGDVNSDSDITVADVILVLKNVVESVDFDSRQKYTADVNADGVVTVLDAVLIQQLILELN